MPTARRHAPGSRKTRPRLAGPTRAPSGARHSTSRACAPSSRRADDTRRPDGPGPRRATSSTVADGAPAAASDMAESPRSAPGSAHTLRPIPTTTQSMEAPVEEDSARIPPSLRSPIMMSFGHLSAVATPRASSPSATATPAANGKSEAHAPEGRRRTDTYRLPLGETQTRPWRPRPAVCESAKTTLPSGAPPAPASSGGRSSNPARDGARGEHATANRGRPGGPGAALPGSRSGFRPQVLEGGRDLGFARHELTFPLAAFRHDLGLGPLHELRVLELLPEAFELVVDLARSPW